jgi:hypothetical protein
MNCNWPSFAAICKLSAIHKLTSQDKLSAPEKLSHWGAIWAQGKLSDRAKRAAERAAG